MKRVFHYCFLFLFLSLSSTIMAQQSPWPKTLLWKISGKGLKKPSYLFGTMHLQDKRIFNLGDSFYHHFERAEGFAIEVDFREYMDSILTKGFQLAEDRRLNEDDEAEAVKNEIKEARIDISDSEKAALPPPPVMSKSMKKAFRKMRNEQIKSLLQYGRMPTILDAYLYGMAMKQGKWLGAVEEVKDQLNLRDELGKDIDEEEESKKPEDILLTSLGNMIKVYLAQDLNQIEEIALDKRSARSKTIMFNNRNLKMARSMDSLSHLRSMFYAVGAAHLPGDSGVIKLLRSNGYTVTPVMSTSTLAAEKYAEKLPAASWYEVGQADGLYKVDMPGIPSEYNLFGDLVKMKVFVDVTTMNFYMTGHSIAQFSADQLEEALRSMARSMNGKLSGVKNADRDDFKAVEGTISGNGNSFRIQVIKKDNTVFFLLMGSSTSYKLNLSQAEKYFNSFKAGKAQVTASPDNWKEFSLPEKAVTVRLPGVPKRNKAFEKQAEGTGWKFSVFDYTDQAAGLYYIFQVRDIEAGLFLEGDSAYFEEFKTNILKENVTALQDETIQVQGYPALRFDAESAKESIFYTTLNVVRGNRVYTMMVLGHISRKDDPGMETYFNSLKLHTYTQGDWSVFTSDNLTFSSRVPSAFVRDKEEEKEDSTRIHYTSFDPLEVVSYEVIKDALPAYFWTASDTGFYRIRANSAKGYNDSLLAYRFVKNGNISGVEQLIQSPGSKNIKRMRYLLHADTIYTLISFVPLQYVSDARHSVFFDEFRIKNDQQQPTVLRSKAKELLPALADADSLVYQQARVALGVVTFSREELPLLHKALLARYADDTLDYNSTRTKLVNALEELADSSTVDFIRTHYDELKSRGSDQVALLQVLVNLQSTYSYQALKELFTGKTPGQLGQRNSLGYRVTDSLELTALLFPEVLNLLRNPDFSLDVMDYTVTLLDSGRISTALLAPYEKDILHTVDTLLSGNRLREEDAWTWQYRDILHLLGYLNTAASNARLQQFLKEKDLYLKERAVICLLRNNQPVEAKEMEKLAASNEYRLSFYNDLKQIKKESFFTPKYKTQRFFAEAEMYRYASDEDTPSSLELIGEKIADFNGQKMRFFLYRVGYNYGEKKEQDAYFGVAGPYELNAALLETSGEMTDMQFDEQYDKKETDRLFREMLERAEEYLRKKQD
ncbi:MAG: TraB/GumN family protein [Chitinophagales bacterium]|nr:TraB/GumN family protein [Chitinophagales bacterium]